MSQANQELSVVVGLGKTGLSCVHYLIKQGYSVAVMDTRSQPPDIEELKKQFPDITCKLGELDQSLLLQAKQIVVSPGVSIALPPIQAAAQHNIPIVGDIELFAHAVDSPVVAITGTNGKSTVTTLVGEFFKGSGRHAVVAGNIGVPVLDLLNSDTPIPPEAYVLELSSFQLETTSSLLPRAATILNVTPDHMDRYHNFADYVAAKQRIYHNCGVAVWNRDDINTYPDSAGDIISFGSDEPAAGMFGLREKYGITYLALGEENLFPVTEMKLQGKHNWMNALAALALGHAIGLSMENMLEVLRHFSGLAHRCQLVRKLNDVTWYNDSKATNIGATQATLTGLGAQINGKMILIAGGLGKGADFNELRTVITPQIKKIIVLGEAATDITAALNDLIAIEKVADLAEAVQAAQKTAEPGDAVVLAPACASWDMFKDFTHRGDVFTQLVQQL